MGSSSHDRSMTRLLLRLSSLSLVLCLPSFSGAGAAGHSGEDGDRVDSARIEKAVAGLKETEQALFLYERIERVEERRSLNDTRAADVKIFRVFPAGTGAAHIPLGPDLAPANAEVYRSDLEKLLNSLMWAAQSGKPQREQPGMALGLRSRLGARHAGQGRRLSAPSRGSTRAKPTLAQTLAPSDGGRPAPGPCHRDIICH